jgi:bifunctional non-homologous end joining protein LigD
VKLRKPGAKREWLLIKHRDEEADPEWNIEEHVKSVKSGKLPAPPRHPRAPAKSPRAASPNPSKLSRAILGPVPKNLRPALASLGKTPSQDSGWLYEIKWDGIRVIPFVENGKTTLMARSGRDITREYPEFKSLASLIHAREAVLDGEIVVLDQKGRSQFQRLQARFGRIDPSEKLQQQAPPTLYLFDVVHCDGVDLRRSPLGERKRLLDQLVGRTDSVRLSEYQIGKGQELFPAAIANGLEGIIGKQANSGYPDGRTASWLKFKRVNELDAVVGGWTSPRGSRQYFGSLLVGLYDGAELKFVGGVGTGYPREAERTVFEQLTRLASEQCPFALRPRTREQAHWIKPALIARVGYAEWTSDQHLRQPRFMGLQPDRSPKECTFMKEKPTERSPKKDGAKPPKRAIKVRARRIGPNSAPASNAGAGDVGKVLTALRDSKTEEVRLTLGGKELKLTHLGKVYFPEDGYTKRDVLAYYATVSSHLLPFLADRPLVLHRYPNGIDAPAFYQKESGPSIPEWIRTVNIFSESKRQEIAYFLADDLASLLYLTNLGCIEHNPFSAHAEELETPDYMFIDLDPTEGTAFSRVTHAAVLFGKILAEARLQFFVKTSGATGIHVFVPIARKYGFDQVRDFLEIVARIAGDRESGLLTRIHTVKDRPKNSVFVDVRQNAYAQSLASVFSIRPRNGAPVSTPIAVTELNSNLQPSKWNIHSVLEDLPSRARLWSGFWKTPQTLDKALEALSREVSYRGDGHRLS